MRYNISTSNTNPVDTFIDFDKVGNLSTPIYGKKEIQIINLSIPSGGVPVLVWETGKYYMTLSYSSFSVTQEVSLIDYGEGSSIFEISHLRNMLNAQMASLVTALESVVMGLPSLDVPQFYFDETTQLWHLTAITSAYNSSLATPIKISVNSYLFNILQGLPNKYNPTTNLYTFQFDNLRENVYNSTYTRLIQESISVKNFAEVQKVYLITNLPVENEIFSSDNSNTNNWSRNVLANLTVDYSEGLKKFRAGFNFSAPSQFYRVSLGEINNVYNLGFRVYYENLNNELKQMRISSNSFCAINFEVL